MENKKWKSSILIFNPGMLNELKIQVVEEFEQVNVKNILTSGDVNKTSSRHFDQIR